MPMSLRRFLIFALVPICGLFGLAGLSQPVSAQALAYPHCDLSDSVASIAAGLDDLLHPFGTPGYTHEFTLSGTFPVFNSVFELYLSHTVSDRWTSTDFQTLIGSILDNDSTTTDDIFGKVWYYFTREGADENEYHAGVRFTTPEGVFDRIRIRLYAREDIPGYPNSCNSSLYGNACKGYSFASANVITINASPANSMSVVLNLGIAHELTHVCWNANGLRYDAGYYSINETLATLGEYFLDGWRPGDFDIPYDASFMRQEQCDQDSKYDVEKLWITYLYEGTKVNPSDPTDDLRPRPDSC